MSMQDPLEDSIYILKIKGKTSDQDLIQVRNAAFELVGQGLLHDGQEIRQLWRAAGKAHNPPDLPDVLKTLPYGQIERLAI
ncbi:MAG: hypothetical protein AAF570_08415 [Bacteroidota bacterium]